MSDRHSDLSLLIWEPVRTVIVFPLARQRARVIDVARKLMTKRSERHEEQYRDQVTRSVFRGLSKLGLSEIDQDEQLGAFWSAVEREHLRMRYRNTGNNNPNGAA